MLEREKSELISCIFMKSNRIHDKEFFPSARVVLKKDRKE